MCVQAGGHERLRSVLYSSLGSGLLSSGAGGTRTHDKRTGEIVIDTNQILLNAQLTLTKLLHRLLESSKEE